MKPTLSQQAIAGLVVLFVIVATLAGGIVLGLADRPVPAASRPPVVAQSHTPAPQPTSPQQAEAPSPSVTSSPSPRPPTPTVGVLPPTATPDSPAEPTEPPAPTAPPIIPTACGPPAGWVPYQVQAGENLFRIGLRYGRSVDQMMSANCLSDGRIYAGQSIYVPPVSPIPPTSPPPTSPPADPPAEQPVAPPQSAPQPPSSGLCSDPNSVITSPGSGATLTGTIALTGTANVQDFDHYALDIRADGSDEHHTFVNSRSIVVGGLLGELDTSAYEPGQYWLRLLVYNTAGEFLEPCIVPVTITHE